MKSTGNAHPNKYRYNGYGIGFDEISKFRLSDGKWGKNIVIFEINNSSSMHANNIKNIY